MVHYNKIPQAKREGKIVYGDGIVEGIVHLAVSEIDNVELYSNGKKKSVKKAIKAVFDKSGVTVDVAVKINYMQSVSDMAFKVQEAIRHNVESMTEYQVQSVNVHVFGVSFEDKMPPVFTEQTEEISASQG